MGCALVTGVQTCALPIYKFRVGMRAGHADLALRSFLMATAHGAGLMLIPVLLGLSTEGGHGAHAHHPAPMPAGLGDSLGLAVVAAGVHTAAMLLATGGIAVLVYDRLGLAILRRGAHAHRIGRGAGRASSPRHRARPHPPRPLDRQ